MSQSDMVNHPPHYTTGKIECLDFILDQELDYLRGNAVKYIVRAGRKTADPREDIKKAIFYLNKYVEEQNQWAVTSGKTSNVSAKQPTAVMKDESFQDLLHLTHG